MKCWGEKLTTDGQKWRRGEAKTNLVRRPGVTSDPCQERAA